MRRPSRPVCPRTPADSAAPTRRGRRRWLLLLESPQLRPADLPLGGPCHAEARPLVDNPSQVRSHRLDRAADRRECAGAVRGNKLLQQLHAAQLRRPARRRSAAAQLPGAGGRPRHDRLQGLVRHRPRSGGARADEHHVRAGRKAPARRGRDQPLRGHVGRQVDLGRRQDRVRHGGVRRKSQPAAQKRRRTRCDHGARGRSAGTADRARRTGDRGDRAGRLRPVHRGRACWRRSSCCC